MADFSHFDTVSPNAVVVGLAPEKLDYEHLNRAFRILSGEEGDGQASLIATHRASYYREEDGKLSLGPGGFVSALEQTANVTAEVVGKPSRSFFETCLRSFEADGVTEQDWSQVGMIGDDWKNDLSEGAQELGLRRYLVKTGKFRQGDEEKAGLSEGDGGVFDTFASLVDHILAE